MPEKFTTSPELKIPDLIMDIKITPEKLGALGISVEGSTFLFSKETLAYEKKGDKLEIIETTSKGKKLKYNFSKSSRYSPYYISLEISEPITDDLSKECLKLLIKYPNNLERILYLV